MEPTFDRLYNYLFGLPADASADRDPNKAYPTAIFILNLDKVCLHRVQSNSEHICLTGSSNSRVFHLVLEESRL